ncbi:hypothetical protein C8J56DRAFT_1174800 [Mycena floridula]|nr:hypothetical protein C8J56DRAFT_1174800 [Mycena floridula]
MSGLAQLSSTMIYSSSKSIKDVDILLFQCPEMDESTNFVASTNMPPRSFRSAFRSAPVTRPVQIDRATIRRDILHIPGPLDRWIHQNSQNAWFTEFSPQMLEGIGGNEVLCQLFRIVVEAPAETGDDFFTPDPDTHFLWLKAYAPFLLEEVESPWAILDMHVGELCNLDAPDWMGSDWNGSTVCFRQDRAQFALLFASMAFWEHNAQRPENVGKMLHWARSLSGGTSLATIWTLQDMTRGPRAPQRNVAQSIRRVFVVVLLDPQGMKLEPQEIHETGMPDDRYKGLVIQAQNLQYPFTPPWVQYAVIVRNVTVLSLAERTMSVTRKLSVAPKAIPCP